MITRISSFGLLLAPVITAAVLMFPLESSYPAQLTAREIESTLPELKEIAIKALKDSGVPGMAIAVVHDDKVIFLEGFGVRKVGDTAPVDGDTIFQLASVSKPMTSTLIARLVSEGKLRWDDPVVKYDPNFKLKDDYVTQWVTFRDLLSHRSGLPDHAGDLLEDLGYDRNTILSRLKSYELDNKFRSEYAYTNFGMTEAAVAAAMAVGMSYEDLIAEQLFRPLGMTRTSAKFADYQKSENHAENHVPTNAKLIADGKWEAKYTRDPDAQSPAGGISSSAKDMAQWMRLQLSEGNFEGQSVIKVEDLAETHKPQMLTSYDPLTGKSGFYGLCWNVAIDNDGRVFWKHSGEFMFGARTVVSLCPEEKLGIVVLVNAAPNGLPEGIEMSFYNLVFRKKLSRDWIAFANEKLQEMTNDQLKGDGTDYSKPAADQQPAQPLSAYVGKYNSDFYGPLEVTEKEGRLTATLGPKNVALALSHYTGNTFYCETAGESMSGTSGVIFGALKKGKAGTVTVNFLNKEGLGEFRRETSAKSAETPVKPKTR